MCFRSSRRSTLASSVGRMPNMRLKLSGLLLRESAVPSLGAAPRGGRSLAPARTLPAA